MLNDYLALPEVVFLRNHWPWYVALLVVVFGVSFARRFWSPMPKPKPVDLNALAEARRKEYAEAPAPVRPIHAVLSYTGKPGDTLFLIPSRPIAPDKRRALIDQLREVPTLRGVEVVVLPYEFRVEGK